MSSQDLRLLDAALVEETSKALISAADAQTLADQFRLLGDPGRVRMIYALLEAGEMAVCDIAAVVGASESATSHQLRKLRDAGLVRFRKDGRTVLYAISDLHVRLLLDVAAEHQFHEHHAPRP